MLTEKELRAFFLHLVTVRKVSRSTLIVYRSGIRFMFEVTLGRTWPVFDLVRPANVTRCPSYSRSRKCTSSYRRCATCARV